MFNRVFISLLFALIFQTFSLAANSVKSDQDILINDFRTLHETAYQNNWSLVTKRVEVLLKEFERSSNVDLALVQLRELKAFVLSNNLNPKKEELFLEKLNNFEQDASAWKNLKIKSIQVQDHLNTKTHPVAIVSKSTTSQIKSQNFYSREKFILFLKFGSALAAFVLLFFVFYRIKIRQNSKVALSVSFKFEELIDNDKANLIWSLIKDDLSLLLDQMKYLDSNNVKVFCLDDLFSLEFSILNDEFSSSNIKALLDKISLLAPEAYVEKTFDEEGVSSRRKLILNFSY